MSQYFQIHPGNPQRRLIIQAAEFLQKGGVIIYPTDSGYALGCRLADKEAMARICRIRNIEGSHHFTLMCRDLSELATYAWVDNRAFRQIKNNTPGHYTFILKATREVPRRLMNQKRKTLGLRVPGNPIARALLEQTGAPMMSTSLILPGNEFSESDPQQIYQRLGDQVDLVIDGGALGQQQTTIIDLTTEVPVVVREGAGDPAPFQ